MKKVLLHTCCAPCATQVFEDLKAESLEVTGFFYNPNIQPKEEYDKRKKCMEEYSKFVSLPMYFIENDLEHKSGDCPFCYETRLARAAQFAKNGGYDAFTTTLLISPYQNHDLIKKIAYGIEDEFGIVFLYRDFRLNYNKGRKLARQAGLYMQKYCGCFSSLKLEGKNYEQTA